MGAAVERHTGTTLADDRHYMEHLPDHAREFAGSGMCPAPWRIERSDKPEVVEQKIADLTVVGRSLAELDMRLSLNVIPQVYVVHGRPGFSAQLQIALAARYGCHIVPLDEESDHTVGVVKVLGKDRQWHRVAVSIEDAKTAGWFAKNPNYKTMPDRMLMARAVTKAIGQHCPEAKMMLPPADLEEAGEDVVVDADTGEITTTPAAAPVVDRQVPPRSVTPAGTTIPEHVREPAIDDDARAELLARLETLEPAVLERVKAQARDLAIPNLKSPRVTRAHGALIAMIIHQAVADQGRNPAGGDTQEPEHLTPEVVGPGEQPTLYEDPAEEPF